MANIIGAMAANIRIIIKTMLNINAINKIKAYAYN